MCLSLGMSLHLSLAASFCDSIPGIFSPAGDQKSFNHSFFPAADFNTYSASR